MEKGRILVMDDDEDTRILVTQALKFMGYDVATTKDGAETIELYKFAKKLGFPYDTVILDIVIPGGMDGEMTVRKLVEIDPEVKVIVSSAYSNNPVMADFRRYGFKDVLPKPYTIQELHAVLNRVMESAIMEGI